MNQMKPYKGYSARVEFDGEDEIFVGRIAGINDVVGFHGDTVEDLKAAFHEAVDDYLATCEKAGKTPEKAFSGNVMVRVPPEVHARAALAAELSGKSFNQWAVEIFREAAERASSMTHIEIGSSRRMSAKPLAAKPHRRSRGASQAKAG